MTTITRKLPIGIQTFETIRTANYLYVDKTALVYNLASELASKLYLFSKEGVPPQGGREIIKLKEQTKQ